MIFNNDKIWYLRKLINILATYFIKKKKKAVPVPLSDMDSRPVWKIIPTGESSIKLAGWANNDNIPHPKVKFLNSM